MMSKRIGDREHFVLLAIARLKRAYALEIHEELLHRINRRAEVGSALLQLQKKGFVKFKMTGARPIRGGRKRKLYSLTKPGATYIINQRKTLEKMWRGLVLPIL